MNGVNYFLVFGSIVVLFVVWNFKALFFSQKAAVKSSMKKSTGALHSNLVKDVGVDNEASSANQVIAEILSLNRAVHTLTQSGGLMDKLLKMDPQASCDILLRDYELSSVMVMVKHEEHGEVEEGFKKIPLTTSQKSSVQAPSESNDFVSDSVSYSKQSLQNTTTKIIPKEDPHHTKTDPLRIALYCKNLLRPPRIGRAVRLVDSVADPSEQYIIELVK